MSERSPMLARFAGLPEAAIAALDDLDGEVARAAMPILVARAEILMRCSVMGAADFVRLTRAEQAAMATAERRIEAGRCLVAANASRGTAGAIEVMATVDETEAEVMLLDALGGGSR